MPRARDDLAQARQLRDDLRALKAQYPELTSPEEQDRLEDYMRTQIDDIGIHREAKEDTHARKRRPAVRRRPRQPQPQSPSIRPASD